MSLLRTLLRLLPLDRKAKLLAWAVPSSHRYRAALHLSRLHGHIRGALGGNASVCEAFMLDFWLRSLTFSGPFPIPVHIVDTAPLTAIPPGQGVLLCSTHTPLVQVALRALTEFGLQPVIVADTGNIVGRNEVVLCGLAQRATAIPADCHALTRLRTVLRSGGTGVCLADASTGTELSGAAMRLAGRLGCRTIFGSVERRADGVIAVSITDPPFPYNRSVAEVQANLDSLRRQRQSIFASLGEPPSTPVSLDHLACPTDA